jgi:ABC-type molybdate transport system substrate-binding protein
MRRHVLIAATVVAAFASFTDTNVGAAEVKLLAAIGVREIITELAPQFESTTGHKLVTTFDASGRIAQRISGGEAFDLIIINKPAIERIANTGKVNVGSAKDVASSVVGAAVRKGAARPDISTTEAFKRAFTLYGALGSSSSLTVQNHNSLSIATRSKSAPELFYLGPNARESLGEELAAACGLRHQPLTRLRQCVRKQCEIY